MQTFTLQNGFHKPSLSHCAWRVAAYLCLAGWAFLIAMQVPTLTPSLIETGVSFYVYIFAFPCVLVFTSLLVAFNHGSRFDFDSLGPAVVITVVIALIIELGSFFSGLPVRHMGFYNLDRFEATKRFTQEASVINPDFWQHPHSAPFKEVMANPTPSNIHRTVVIRKTAITGQELQKILSASALLKMQGSEFHQHAAAKGWVSEEELEKAQRDLRANPPAERDLSSTHAAAYLYLTGGETIMPEEK